MADTKLVLQWSSNTKSLARVTDAAVRKATEWAGRDALRVLASGANKGVRERKALKLATVKAGMRTSNPRKGSPMHAMVWTLRTSGALVPLMEYPHRDTHKTGVWVTVNKGARKQLRHAFVARMKSGHVGIFQRVTGAPRFPIKEGFSTRLSEPVGDLAPELLRKASAVAGRTWTRVIARELLFGARAK